MVVIVNSCLKYQMNDLKRSVKIAIVSTNMKKHVISLYTGAVLLVVFEWIAARGEQNTIIRGDCLNVAYALGISAVILSIGVLTNKVSISAQILKYAAVAYIVMTTARVLYTTSWEGFEWWHIIIWLVALLILLLPAIIVFMIGVDTLKKSKQS